MLAEKMGNLPEMERLLRQVIAPKPDYHHAYNALGYSLAERNMRLPEAKAADPEGAGVTRRAIRSSATAWPGWNSAWATRPKPCAS